MQPKLPLPIPLDPYSNQTNQDVQTQDAQTQDPRNPSIPEITAYTIQISEYQRKLMHQIIRFSEHYQPTTLAHFAPAPDNIFRNALEEAKFLKDVLEELPSFKATHPDTIYAADK